jgi:CHAT domain-containing protein/tetratricopeptide (TPR) repeat protein
MLHTERRSSNASRWLVGVGHAGVMAFAWLALVSNTAALTVAPRPALQESAAVSSSARDRNRRLAEKVFSEGERLHRQWTTASLRGAVEKYKESLRLWRLAGEAASEVRTLNIIGDVSYSVGDTTGALDYYNKALSVSKIMSDRRGEALSLGNVCYTLAFLGEPKKALDSCQAALSISRELGDDGLVGQSLGNLGRVYYSLSDMSKALELFRQAVPLLHATGQSRKEAQALLNSGYTYANLSDTPHALACYQDALPLWRAANDKRGEALTLAALGHLYNKLEEKQKALDYYDQAIQLFRAMGDRYGEANTLNGIAFIYWRLGEWANALDYHNRALHLFQLTNYRAGQALALTASGRIYNDLGDYQNALSRFQQALSISRDLGDPLVESYVLGYLGKLYHSQGDSQKALDYYSRALQLNRTGQDKREEAYTLNNIGHIYDGLGDKQKALDYFQQSLRLSELVSDPGGASLSYYSIASVERDRGNLEDARLAIANALKISEELRGKVTGKDLRATYFATVHQQFELHLDVLMRLHKIRPTEGFDVIAFETAERGLARSLLETLVEARSNIRQGVNTEILRRERELQRQLNAKAERRIQLAGGKSPTEELTALEREVSELTTEYQRVQGQIRSSSPRYAALVQPVPLTLREIQQQVMDADTLLLEYALGEKRSFVWAVTPSSIKSFELPPRAEVEKAARRMYELLTARNQKVKGETEQQRRARVRQSDEEYEAASLMLGRMLLGPVISELGQKRLVIVTDGALQYIPFAALPVPDKEAKERQPGEAARENKSSTRSDSASTLPPGGFTPLIFEHEVVSLPSASVLALIREELRGRRPAPKSVAVLADPIFDRSDERLASARTTVPRPRRRESADGVSDVAATDVAERALRDFDDLGEGAGIARLPFSWREAEAIMASVPTKDGMLASGFRASRATATSPELSQYRIVHFATHGLLNSEHPELSGVVLSLFDEAGKRQDGFLQLHEIYNLHLPAELVVLSACQTALGKEVRGEGLVGLTRGFMYAGAPRVVASLWKVDDAATARLMGEFYRAMLGEGMRPAAALRAAQVYMWRQNQWRSPYYWAAFTLQGEWK